MCSACLVCQKTVRSNQRAIFCDCCLEWTHAKCAFLSNEEYIILGRSYDPWFCTHCLQSIFPFNHISSDHEFMIAITDCVNYMSLSFKPFLSDVKETIT